MSRKSKRNPFFSCKIKKVHFDFWSAMQHCASLQQANPFSYIAIYKCDFCEGMHITTGGVGKKLSKIKKALDKNLKIMRDPLWWDKAPPEVIEHRVSLEIELVKKFYGMKPINNRRLP